jgi:hypothetical protein
MKVIAIQAVAAEWYFEHAICLRLEAANTSGRSTSGSAECLACLLTVHGPDDLITHGEQVACRTGPQLGFILEEN